MAQIQTVEIYDSEYETTYTDHNPKKRQRMDGLDTGTSQGEM